MDEGIYDSIEVLRDGDDAAKTEAAQTLNDFALDDDVDDPCFKEQILAEGGIEQLIDLLRADSAEAKQWAATALCNLARRHEDIATRIAQPGLDGIALLIKLLQHGNEVAKINAAQALRNVAYHENWGSYDVGTYEDNADQIVQAGAIPPLVGLLRDGDDARDVAAEALSRLVGTAIRCLGTVEGSAALVGAIPPLVALWRQGTTDGKERAEVVLHCISAHSADSNVAIAAAIGPEELLKLAQFGQFRAMDHLFRGGDPAMRKAKLVVCKMLRSLSPDDVDVPRDVFLSIGSYLEKVI